MKNNIFTFFLIIIIGISLMFLKSNYKEYKARTVFKSDNLTFGSYTMHLNGMLASNISSFAPGDLLVLKLHNVKNISVDEMLIREVIEVESNSNINLSLIHLYEGEINSLNELAGNKALKLNSGTYTSLGSLMKSEETRDIIYTIYFDAKAKDEYQGKRLFFQFSLESTSSSLDNWDTEFTTKKEES